MRNMEGKPRHIKLKIVFAIIGAISGVSIFVAFAYYRNVNAAVWGLLSTIYALLVLQLHRSCVRDTLQEKYGTENLTILKWFGAFSTITTIIAAITYFIMAAVLKQGYKIPDDGYMPAGVFALMTLKWTFMLFWFSKTYLRYLKAQLDGEVMPIAN